MDIEQGRQGTGSGTRQADGRIEPERGYRSAAGGLLFNVGPLPDASFLLAIALTVLGILLSFGLPDVLAARKLATNVGPEPNPMAHSHV
ncbi:MAG: hypothetical protein M3Z85_04095 [Acidobacteriota bacterium]|nr:hypothetical protein [Acidobacteriota bacterium]